MGSKRPRHDRRAATLAYRRQYRRAFVPRGYHGRRHLVLVLATGICVLAALAFAFPQAFHWHHLWMVPATLVVASGVEYATHRGPMHHPVAPLGAMFNRHTRQHHRYFTPAAIRVHGWRDLRAVLFPPPMLLFFGGVAAAIGVVAAWVLGTELAVLFVATSLAYYLLYEVLHLAYHLPPTVPVARWPVVRQLAHLHRVHHARSRMRQANFNLVLPLFDWLLGTLVWRAGRPARAARTDRDLSPQSGPR